MSASVSGIRRSSTLLALSGLSMVAEAATAMAPESPVPMNITASPRYMEPVRLVQFNPALAAVAVGMILSCFLVGFATGYLKKCIRPAEADPEDEVVQRRGRRAGGPAPKSQCGLDQEILDALPRFQYKDLPADEQVRKYFDCSVCLAAFDANDSLRLLPECSHVFHSDCIDAWFLSHNTCPLCRACLAPHMEKPSGEEREGDAEDGERVEIRVPESFDIVEVVISGAGRSQSTPISESLRDRTGGAQMANPSTVDERERVITHPFLRSTEVGSFKPAVRVVTAPEKAAALASIRRSNSAGTDLQQFHPNYVVDSEGTQHNRNYQTHAIDVEEFLLKDHRGAQAQPSASSSRHPVTPTQYWLPQGMETGASSMIQPTSRLDSHLVQSARWSSPNLRQFAPA